MTKIGLRRNALYRLQEKYLEYRALLPPFFDDLIWTFLAGISDRNRLRLARKLLPKVFRGVEICPLKFDSDGALCISIDLELSWAWRFTLPPRIERGEVERRNFDEILQVLDHFHFPVTWAVVGHLFLTECQKEPETGVPHPNMPRPSHFFANEYMEWKTGDWYQHDPCTMAVWAPCWYAPDLIRKILSSKIEHEVAIHSFSHIDFSSESCSVELACAELSECVRVMNEYGLMPRSIVFPYNFEGHLCELSKYGLISYRGNAPQEGIIYPVRRSGVWGIHQTLHLASTSNPMIDRNYVARCKRLIERAVQSHSVCHLWFHPWEMNPVLIQNVLKPILEYSVALERIGRLWVAPMKDIASYCEARDRSELCVENEETSMQIFIRCIIDEKRFGLPEITMKVAIPYNRSVTDVYVGERKVSLGTKQCFVKQDSNSNLLVVTFSVSEKVLTFKWS